MAVIARAGAAVLATSSLVALVAPAHVAAAAAAVSVFPAPGARFAAPATQITFRGLSPRQLGSITVRGSSSGAHGGRVEPDSDDMGGSFLPRRPFKPGERVTVTTSLDIAGANRGSYSFTIAAPAGAIRLGAFPPAARVRGDVQQFVSRPDLTPVAISVTKRSSGAQSGDIFVAPQNGPLQKGPMIFDPTGRLVWFRPLPSNSSAADFRVQSYHGSPVLTWWQGALSNIGVGLGVDEIYDSSYRQIATVRASNGLSADLHEFQITPQGTALLTAYYPVYVNGSSGGKSVRRVVLDSVAQEIDIPTGLVLFQWDSLDHVGFGDSYVGPLSSVTSPYDAFHINSIEQDLDGNLLVSARNTWTVYKVSRQTGAIIWRLGGKHSSFKMGPNTQFAFQHDARVRPGNEITIFDDGAGPPSVHKQSRALTLRLDTTRMTATLASQNVHSPGLLASFEGNVQLLQNGDQFVGWGQQPFFTEFNGSGGTVFDARFADTNTTYRAYRFAWSSSPATLPRLAVRASGQHTTAYVSWNGATSVARWRILGGRAPAALTPVATATDRSFETSLALPSSARYVSVQALDASGQVIKTSLTVKVP